MINMIASSTARTLSAYFNSKPITGSVDEFINSITSRIVSRIIQKDQSIRVYVPERLAPTSQQIIDEITKAGYDVVEENEDKKIFLTIKW